jgi:hypothetical protein
MVSSAAAVAQRELALTREWAGLDAERDFRAALATAEAIDNGHIALLAWKVPLAAFLVGADRCAEAMPLLRDALTELGDKADPAEPIDLPQTRLLFSACASIAERTAAEVSLEQACRSLLALPGVQVDVYPTTRKLLATRCVAMSQ